jgi:hypothetical protein
MFVLGRITTADMPTGEAKSQMNPGVTHLQAFFATGSTGPNFANLFDMLALASHDASLRVQPPLRK